MKKFIVLAFVGLIYTFHVKAQHIVDNNFADTIQKDCSDCIDADNNLQPSAKNLKKLDV